MLNRFENRLFLVLVVLVFLNKGDSSHEEGLWSVVLPKGIFQLDSCMGILLVGFEEDTLGHHLASEVQFLTRVVLDSLGVDLHRL